METIFFYSKSESSSYMWEFHSSRTYYLFGFLYHLAMTFLVSSFITLHLVDVNTIVFPLSAIWPTLRIFYFMPWTNKVSSTPLVLLIMALPFPKTFVGALVSGITLPYWFFFRDSILLFSPVMWWENFLSMYHSFSSSNEQSARPHLICSSYFFFLWERLVDPSFSGILISIFLANLFPCCIYFFLCSFATCQNLLQA